jgi:uncharacterized protein (DUF488 family)
MNIQTTLYSIGHGQKTLEEFYEELTSFNIQYVIDVRSSPYSKWAPQYNQKEIAQYLRNNNIVYAYMGNIIGGRPINDLCYDSEGHFDYEKMAQESSFKKGLNRLVNANEKQFNVAVMCSESDPALCHRSKLIGRELYENYHINMKHIVSAGKFVDEIHVIMELTKGQWTPSNQNLFPYPMPYFKSKKIYKEETEEVFAYD